MSGTRLRDLYTLSHLILTVLRGEVSAINPFFQISEILDI